jgi:high-affinity iron transporter
MIPTFVIFLREGVEASMIVAILLSYLDQIGQRRHFRDVFIGVAAATVLVVAGGISAYLVIHQYSGSTVQTVFETVTFLLAATVLTYMTFWMQSHSRTISSELRQRSDAALEGKARWGLGLLAFQAVGREGLETMVFTLAIVFASTKQAPTSAHGHALLLGAVLGLAVALAIAYAIFKLGKRLNMGLFFRIIGIVLMVFAAGLLIDAVENMQELGWLPFLDHTLWNTSTYLSESSSIGDVFHSLLGYADQPTVLQAIVWVTYLGVATTAFVLMGRRGRHAAAAAARTRADGPPPSVEVIAADAPDVPHPDTTVSAPSLTGPPGS